MHIFHENSPCLLSDDEWIFVSNEGEDSSSFPIQKIALASLAGLAVYSAAPKIALGAACLAPPLASSATASFVGGSFLLLKTAHASGLASHSSLPLLVNAAGYGYSAYFLYAKYKKVKQVMSFFKS